MDDRDRQAIRHRQGLCPAAPPLGGGAHPCLAEPQPPLGEGCRENDRERGNLAIYCQRQAHVAPSGHGVTPRRAPVFPIEPWIWRCRGDSSQTLTTMSVEADESAATGSQAAAAAHRPVAFKSTSAE